MVFDIPERLRKIIEISTVSRFVRVEVVEIGKLLFVK
ncbi:hypothetical protein FHX77_001025 [Bifidobacterium commune]|nr:hypothetical protein [Bifidobacterium commune]MBB2955601.1 hypothetical protein [Bifidobacterium commune]